MTITIFPIEEEKHTSIRVNRSSWELFQKFCRQTPFTQAQILTAMIEYFVPMMIDDEEWKYPTVGGRKMKNE